MRSRGSFTRPASILNIPIHPGGGIPHLAEAGSAAILALREKLRAVQQEAQRTGEFGRAADAYDDTVAKVKMLAGLFHEGLVEVDKAIRQNADRSN